MTLAITSHHIIELIKEDIKLTHLIFGLQDLGLEASADLCNLSLPIFHICGIDLTRDMHRAEMYYALLNSTRGLTLEATIEEMDELVEKCLVVLV